MMVATVLIAIASALPLLGAGYLFGVRLGVGARGQLRASLEQRDAELSHLRATVAQQKAAGNVPENLREGLSTELSALIKPLLEQGKAFVRMQDELRALALELRQRESDEAALKARLNTYLNKLPDRTSEASALRAELEEMIRPLIDRDRNDQELRTSIEELLSPLVREKRLGLDLSSMSAASATRGALPQLLNEVVDRAGLNGALLTDEAGLPLASHEGTKDVERLASIASLLVLLSDRVARDGAAVPQSLLLHDESNQLILCRIFSVASQRLILTATARAGQLQLGSLDPVLPKIENALTVSH